MTPRKLSYVNGHICYIRHARKVAYSYPKASWGLDSLCASRFQTSKASSKEKLMLTYKSLSTCVYFLSSYRSYQLVSFCSTAINQQVSLLLLLQNRIWSKPTSCLTLSVVMASAPQRILVPLFISPEVIAVVESSLSVETPFTISGGVNFNRQLDSVNLNSLPAKKRFLLKRIQNYKGFPSSFVPFPLMTVCRFDVAWTLLQRDASFSINTEWEPANEGFRFRVCIQNGKCLPTWKTLHILFFNDW